MCVEYASSANLNFPQIRLTLVFADEVVPLVRQTRVDTGTGSKFNQAAETMSGREPTFYLL